ncbi:hypothetical protein HQ447_20635 [bacterium]|nr:hypothetical protein [bacterium]
MIAYPEGEHTTPVFAPRCVAAFRMILAAVPSAKVVFSTTWRLPNYVNRLHEQWLAHGSPWISPSMERRTSDKIPQSAADTPAALRFSGGWMPIPARLVGSPWMTTAWPWRRFSTTTGASSPTRCAD